tara:strand:+ start:109 stop:246 length:138 start_codon:yes stop_codon:yes gene_type:complete
MHHPKWLLGGKAFEHRAIGFQVKGVFATTTTVLNHSHEVVPMDSD